MINSNKQPGIKCKHCGKPLPPQRAGAISSYLLKDLRCNCNSKAKPQSSSTAPEICRRYLKKVPENDRDGYFTQFVFGSERCQCKTPLLKKAIKLDERKLATLTRRWTKEDGRSKSSFSTFPVSTLIGGLYQIEPRSISSLNHPCLVQVYDLAWHEDKQPYYVMDCLTGRTLEEILSEDGIGLKQALALFLEVADGLSFAHSQGVVHRDLKQSNIFVEDLASGQTRIKILDFGIAKLIGADCDQQSLTGLGDVFGTPYYMSPKQCLGEAVDARSDIYSLDCTIFEATSGRPPFDDEQPLAVAEAHISSSPPALTEVTSKNKPGLEAVLAKCIEKGSADRYQNIQQLMAHMRLVSASKGDSIKTSSSSSFHQEIPAKQSADLNAPLLVSLGILTLALLTVAAMGLTFFTGGTDKGGQKPVTVQRKIDVEVTHIFSPIGGGAEDINAEVVKPQAVIARVTVGPRTHEPPKPPTTLSMNGQVKYYQLDFGSDDHGILTFRKSLGVETNIGAKGEIVVPIERWSVSDFSPRYENDLAVFKAFPDDYLCSLSIDVQLAELVFSCCDKQRQIEHLHFNSTFVSAKALNYRARLKSLRSLYISVLADTDEAELVNTLPTLTNLETFDCKLVFYPNSDT